jgi:hypothetical protein
MIIAKNYLRRDKREKNRPIINLNIEFLLSSWGRVLFKDH